MNIDDPEIYKNIRELAESLNFTNQSVFRNFFERSHPPEPVGRSIRNASNKPTNVYAVADVEQWRQTVLIEKGHKIPEDHPIKQKPDYFKARKDPIPATDFITGKLDRPDLRRIYAQRINRAHREQWQPLYRQRVKSDWKDR